MLSNKPNHGLKICGFLWSLHMISVKDRYSDHYFLRGKSRNPRDAKTACRGWSPRWLCYIPTQPQCMQLLYYSVVCSLLLSVVSHSQTLAREERVWWLAIHGVVPAFHTERHQIAAFLCCHGHTRVQMPCIVIKHCMRTCWNDRQAHAAQYKPVTRCHVKQPIFAFQQNRHTKICTKSC